MSELISGLSNLTNLERVLLPTVAILTTALIAIFKRWEKAVDARLLDRHMLEDMARVLVGVEKMVTLTYELLKERVR